MRLSFGNRWIVSFIDLTLIMLGAMALLIAGRNEKHQVASAVATTFGRPKQASQNQNFLIGQLFEKNEARLSQSGKDRISQIAQAVKAGDRAIYINVSVDKRTTDRLQEWELAAARIASIAYMMKKFGVQELRIIPELPRSAATKSLPGVNLRTVKAP